MSFGCDLKHEPEGGSGEQQPSVWGALWTYLQVPPHSLEVDEAVVRLRSTCLPPKAINRSNITNKECLWRHEEDSNVFSWTRHFKVHRNTLSLTPRSRVINQKCVREETGAPRGNRVIKSLLISLRRNIPIITKYFHSTKKHISIWFYINTCCRIPNSGL